MDNFPGREDEYPRIVVVIPAYRAEKFIIKILSGIPPFVSNIVVVDDCSPDRTAELVYAFNDSRICLVSHETNQGVGKAMLTGYCKALELGAKIIVKMDSDDQMDPAYLVPLIAPILTGQADYTKGNRFLHANELKAMPFIRRIGNAGLSFLTKAASGYWNLFDPTNGYTAIRSSAAGYHQNPPALLLRKQHVDRVGDAPGSNSRRIYPCPLRGWIQFFIGLENADRISTSFVLSLSAPLHGAVFHQGFRYRFCAFSGGAFV